MRRGDGSYAGGAVMAVVREFRSFGWPSRLLMINQFGINLGFYMLMPYLAGYLAGPLGLAAHLLRSPAQSHEPVATVALAAGFADASHFGRVFRAEYGMSPGAWRRDAVT